MLKKLLNPIRTSAGDKLGRRGQGVTGGKMKTGGRCSEGVMDVREA